MIKPGTRVYHKDNYKITGLIIKSFDSMAGYLMYEVLCGGEKWVFHGKSIMIKEAPTEMTIKRVAGL